MEYVIFDLETNESQEIIEIGAVKVNANSEMSDTFHAFVKPTLNPKIGRFVKRLTGISEDTVKHSPPFPVVFQRFLQWTGGNRELVAWGESDELILRNEFSVHQIPSKDMPTVINLQPIVRKLIGADSAPGLKTALEAWGIPHNGKHHRAVDDAINTCMLFVKALNLVDSVDVIKQEDQWEIDKINIRKQIKTETDLELINRERYTRHLQTLSTDQLFKRKNMLAASLKRTADDTGNTYLLTVLYQKRKIVHAILDQSLKQHWLVEKNLKPELIDDLLNALNSFLRMRKSLFLMTDDLGRSLKSETEKEVVRLRTAVREAYGESFRKIQPAHVYLALEQTIELFERTLCTPYFNAKHKGRITSISSALRNHRVNGKQPY